MAEQERARLILKVDKTLPTPVNPKQLAYCPSMNLLALATADEQIDVYRAKGQRVFGVTRDESAGKVTSMQWKPDGKG